MIADRNEQLNDERILAQQLEYFRHRWSPIRDHREARDFECELYQLIQCIYRVAQQPLVKQMSAALASMPPGPIFFEKDNINTKKAP